MEATSAADPSSDPEGLNEDTKVSGNDLGLLDDRSIGSVARKARGPVLGIGESSPRYSNAMWLLLDEGDRDCSSCGKARSSRV